DVYKRQDIDTAVNHATQMATEGAAIIDIGPESTRPGSKPVTTQAQIERAIPVIAKLRRNKYLDDIAISIDTRQPQVAAAAIKAGANMINDVTALADGDMAKLAAEKEVPVVLMHMQGSPETMQAEPKYTDVVAEVLAYLVKRAEYAQQQGIVKERIFIDPGIGFGKTTEHNIELMRNIAKFVDTGYKVLIGTSRKRFIGEITGKEAPEKRLFGTAGTVAAAVMQGAAVVRVHDAGQMADVVRICNRLR
ncbi:MAG TPA: dihydropteroate synthase, partial [Phycisphaerales bacterium]|nr:dihydropteroate synthase [Phycisphaerales bacterium]